MAGRAGRSPRVAPWPSSVLESADVRVSAAPPCSMRWGCCQRFAGTGGGFEKRSGIRVVMNLDEVGRLPRPIETALFRVVQESLTNVHRHAAATTASIRLTATADVVALEIHDQDTGFVTR